VDAVRVGRSIRALRVRQRLRQVDLGQRTGCSRSLLSKIEQGDVGTVDIGRLSAICQALGAELDVRVRWHGEGLDRLLDEAHARLVESVVRRLAALGWDCSVEVSFSEFGERGSVDVLGWHPGSRSLLVIEAKSTIPDAQATLMPLDRKARLGRKIAVERGLDPLAVSRLLVVAESTTNRRRVEALDATFRSAFPDRGVAVTAWLRRPGGRISGLLFLPDSTRGGVGQARPAVRRVSTGHRQQILAE